MFQSCQLPIATPARQQWFHFFVSLLFPSLDVAITCRNLWWQAVLVLTHDLVSSPFGPLEVKNPHTKTVLRLFPPPKKCMLFLSLRSHAATRAHAEQPRSCHFHCPGTARAFGQSVPSDRFPSPRFIIIKNAEVCVMAARRKKKNTGHRKNIVLNPSLAYHDIRSPPPTLPRPPKGYKTPAPSPQCPDVCSHAVKLPLVHRLRTMAQHVNPEAPREPPQPKTKAPYAPAGLAGPRTDSKGFRHLWPPGNLSWS